MMGAIISELVTLVLHLFLAGMRVLVLLMTFALTDVARTYARAGHHPLLWWALIPLLVGLGLSWLLGSFTLACWVLVVWFLAIKVIAAWGSRHYPGGGPHIQDFLGPWS